MPIPSFSKTSKILLAVALGAGVFSAPAAAFDPEKTFKPDDKPKVFLRYGMSALKQGNVSDAVQAFRMGADKNDLPSQWKLAHMLQRGNGVPQNHLAAYKLYAKIADRFVERAPRNRRDRAFVSSAIVALGRYSLNGIQGTWVTRDPRRAESFFYRAAALYKDRNAQYELGKLYRSNALGSEQPKSAVRWFGLAAKKGHAHAQAQLGEMLYYGEGVKRRPVRGLVMMTKAATQSSARKTLNTIGKMQRKAFAQASAAQRAAARRIIGTLRINRKPVEARSFGLQLKSPVKKIPASQVQEEQNLSLSEETESR